MPDPFELWRARQSTDPETAREPVRLSPGREAMLELAWDDVWEARNGSDGELTAACSRYLDKHHRLHAEQAAEHGVMPTSIEGCTAVLNVAARIITLMEPVE